MPLSDQPDEKSQAAKRGAPLSCRAVRRPSVRAIAQLGERLNGIQEVGGSIPYLAPPIKSTSVWIHVLPGSSDMLPICGERRNC